MRRRTFLAGIGSAAVAWPRSARAQSPRRTRRIGVLMLYGEADPEGQVRADALATGLAQRGWTIGDNLRIDFRWGVGNLDWIRSEVAELLRREPDVILANSDQAARMTQAATRTVPTVFIAGSDPVVQGFVQSLARPGGHFTGFSVLTPSPDRKRGV